MTDLSDFLKVKKVRCVSKNAEDNLTIGKKYKVTHIIFGLQSDNNSKGFYDFDSFEPVLEPVVNPLQGVELTPEFEAVEPVLVDNRQVNIQDIGTDILDTNADIKDTPKFEVGDKVYYSTDKEIYTISEIDSENSGLAYLSQNDDDWDTNAILKFCCHATQENYEMLCNLYPHIEFERPPKELTGSDLARAMFYKGWKYVPCFVSNESDDFAQEMKLTDLIFALDGDRSKEFVGDDVWKYAVPIDPRTGEPLTESILND